jgi:hypothetical protein
MKRASPVSIPSGVLRIRPVGIRRVVAACAASAISVVFTVAQAAEPNELEIALGLAGMLQSARAVISAEQDLINNPTIGDKGLSGDVVLTRGIENFKRATGVDPRTIDPNSAYGRLLAAEMTAIRDVMAEAQASINRADIGFKGFVPAVFGRLVAERFQELMGGVAEIKVTAPPELVRNRRARPDPWETDAIRTRFLAADWPTGKVFAAEAKKSNRDAYRVLVPEYYTQGCLACHGETKGELDITGYPKEGGKVGDLGGVISISLFR